MLTLLLTLPIGISTTASAQATLLPGGHANIVASSFYGPQKDKTVRVSQYQLASDHTLQAEVWSWHQNSMKGDGNAKWTKPFSGYTTTGCLRACPIRTPFGFQSGKSGSKLKGTWSLPTPDRLLLQIGTYKETWRLDTSVPTLTVANLVPIDKESRGWAFASNAPLSYGVSMKDIYASTRLYGPMVTNAYYPLPTQYAYNGFHAPDFTLCSNGTCMEHKLNTSPDKTKWFSSYLATNPAKDYRKVFWNTQVGKVTQMEQPGAICISVKGGGHTSAMLQIIDDNLQFQGIVGVEASLNQMKKAQDIVAAQTLVTTRFQGMVKF